MFKNDIGLQKMITFVLISNDTKVYHQYTHFFDNKSVCIELPIVDIFNLFICRFQFYYFNFVEAKLK